MSGSRLGRGRVGRLALLTVGVLVIIFLIYLYRSTTSEMARLRDLHVKCAQQQEALAAQLQVIYEYKVQLEKTLSNEKSSNAAAKEELQQKASRERSLRDKDSLEAMQRYNSLQQHYKILQSEHQDLQEDCKKKEEVALQNSNKLEATLKELRIELKKAAEDKEKALENLKRKFEEMASERDKLEEKYSSLKKSTGENNGNVERLQKQVMQLQRELDEAKGSPHFSVGGVKIENENNQVVQPRHVNEPILDANDNNINNENNNNHDSNSNNNNDHNNNNNNAENEKPGASDNNQMQMIRPSSQQQAVASAAPAASEGPSKPAAAAAAAARSPTRVKLPLGVPPIPRLIESKDEAEESAAAAVARPPKEAVAGQAPAADAAELEPPARPEDQALDGGGGGGGEAAQQPPAARHVGEQILERREPDGWYKLKHGVQEVGDPHHIEKSGFENPGGNEDVEQYDDYNYKEPQNKNGDLHLEEGEDEREDEDDYMHNMNAVKHE